ncbi:leucine zipper domain-containing protein [Rhodococcus coprophilus]
MSHINAVLTPRTRRRLARMIVEEEHSVSHVAKLFHGVARRCPQTAEPLPHRRGRRMTDRSSRPHRIPHLRRRCGFDAVERWQTRYLPVYGVWATVAVVVIRPIFRSA